MRYILLFFVLLALAGIGWKLLSIEVRVKVWFWLKDNVAWVIASGLITLAFLVMAFLSSGKLI